MGSYRATPFQSYAKRPLHSRLKQQHSSLTESDLNVVGDISSALEKELPSIFTTTFWLNPNDNKLSISVNISATMLLGGLNIGKPTDFFSI